jgi:Xaa-Pro aminopeptidase
MWELQEMTCSFFAAAGMPTPISDPGTTRGYVHGLGHGVGFEIHEYPSFAESAGAEGLLERGDVFTLEPGLYDKEAGFGVRLEDLYLATGEGIENLTPLPYDLDPRHWPNSSVFAAD